MSGEMSSKQMVINISLSKVVATILVVFVHAANIMGYAGISESKSIWVYIVDCMHPIVSCGVPLFFIISGYLLYSKEFDYSNNLKKKIKSLLVPYIIWNLLWIFLEMVGHVISPNIFEDVLSWNMRDWISSMIIDPFYAPLWFIRDLFILNVFAKVLECLIKKLPRIVLWVSIILFACTKILDNRMLTYSFALFTIGGVLGKHPEIIQKIQNISKLSVSIITSVAVALLVCRTTLNELTVLSLLILWIYWVKKLERTTKIKKSVETIYPHIFIIYMTHGKILSFFQIMCAGIVTRFEWTLLLFYITLPTIIIGLSVVFSIIFHRIAPKLYCICTGAR